MTSTYIEPFDFKTIYINYFLGDASIFPFFFVIILAFISAYMNISNTIFLILLAIGSVMFSFYVGASVYILVLFIIGFVIFRMFSRIFQ